MKRESLTVYPTGLIDTKAAAEWLGVSYSWLKKAVAAGTVPCTRVGGRSVRFTADHLAEIVAEGEQQVWRYEAPARTRLRAVS